MAKVYVLIEYFVEDTDIVGIFPKKELAEKAKTDLERIRDEKYYSHCIEEWEMEKLCFNYN